MKFESKIELHLVLNKFITLLLLCHCIVWQKHGQLCIAINWDDVKPMFLVSMYPPPASLQNRHDNMALPHTQYNDPHKHNSHPKHTEQQQQQSQQHQQLYHDSTHHGFHIVNNKQISNSFYDVNHSDNNNKNHSKSRHSNNADAVFHNDDDNKIPVVLNLETETLNEDMMPGGQVAMDRIFGGRVARQHCFPYQVGLLLQRPKGLYWCGGSLISDQFVLTAAHCVDMAKRALVFLGAHEIKNAKEVGQVRLMVNHSNFIVYPTWNPKRLKDDIALVHLPVPIEFNERIHPIQLPKRNYEYRNFKNKLAIASGWGRYATGVHAISGQLRFVKLRVVDGKTCKRSFPLSYRSTNICTSGKQAKSTCNGDSGGPLVLQRKRSKKRVLIGITSFGSIFGCDRGYPAAFTKVASYLDWISDEASIIPKLEFKDAALFRDDIEQATKKTIRTAAATAAATPTGATVKLKTRSAVASNVNVCPSKYCNKSQVYENNNKYHDDKGSDERNDQPVSYIKSYIFKYPATQHDISSNDYKFNSNSRRDGHTVIVNGADGGEKRDIHVASGHYLDSNDDSHDDDYDDADLVMDAVLVKYPDAQLLRLETNKFEKLYEEEKIKGVM